MRLVQCQLISQELYLECVVTRAMAKKAEMESQNDVTGVWRHTLAFVRACVCRSLRACCLGGLARGPFSPTARLPARAPLFSGISSGSTASPTPESSTTVFQVHRGGRNPPSLLSSRRLGYVFNPSRSVCLSPVSPTLP